MFKRYLYTVVFNLLIPLFVLNLWWRSRKNPAYRQRIDERFGYVPARQGGGRCIWVHAVSVGEVIAARPLVNRLLQDFPATRVWVTTTTPTGSAMVQQLFGDRVGHSYCPYDLPDGLRRFLRRLRPDLLLVVETEIWPNLYKACANRQIPLLMVNARLSPRSAQGYARLGVLVRETLRCASWIGTRSQTDADHFLQLGAWPGQLGVSGNLKFELQVPADLPARPKALRSQWGKRPVWVAGSTHAGEEASLLRVFEQLRHQVPDLLLILVPRHPERFASVKALCETAGWVTARRSLAQPVMPETDILLGDTLGELLLWYACADLAFVGGSLLAHGGHNPLEAAVFAVPVISGVHTHNFNDMFPPLCAAGGAVQVQDENALCAQALHWLQDVAARQQAGQQAQAFFTSQQGALELILRQARFHLDQRIASHEPDAQTAGC
ncbi:MAG: lipid IV(A) 3-deoxy-D-manno-octulosonic acid transferase [Candidatus Thiothrix moscowensis]|nr:lipid IV(A) 3-deoxy-D-manno-octulosonic acid transferase [Candidatus Thiothrix moscowensis]